MLLRICLIVAILAGLGSVGVVYYQRSVQIPALITQRDASKQQKDLEIAAHNHTKADLQKTAAALAQFKQEVADTQTEEQKALARAKGQENRADKLLGNLAEVNANLQTEQGIARAYAATGLSPEEVVKLQANVQAARQQVVAMSQDRDTWEQSYIAVHERLRRYVPDPPVMLSSDLKGEITVVDPKWNFVILNIGQAQGAKQDGELLVSRNGRLVAKVVIRSVQKDLCIADLVPNWKLGDLIEGDTVTPAHPTEVTNEVGTIDY